MGRWPKSCNLKCFGATSLLGSRTGYHAYRMVIFTRMLGMTSAETDAVCNNAIKAAMPARIRTSILNSKPSLHLAPFEGGLILTVVQYGAGNRKTEK